MSGLCLLVFSYCLSSIPFGVVIVALFGSGDLRTMGSKNIGATNVMRTQSNKLLGILVFLCDFLKGYVPCILALLYSSGACVVFVALLVVLGHVFPIWCKFKGGKGVATAFGVFCGLTPLVGVLVIITWVSIFILFRISAVSGICSVFSSVIFSIFISYPIENIVCLYFMIAVIVIMKHKQNILKILNSKEMSF